MIIDYLIFIGTSFYLLSALMFLYLFLRTLRTTDGIGLFFLKLLTFSLSISSFIIFTVRILSEYGSLSLLNARAFSVIVPIVLCAVALYLNFLFNNPERVAKTQDTENIKKIKADVKDVKENVKEVKQDVKEVKDNVI